MKTVAILMSTYNGQKYLREQMESLLQQEGVTLKIVVRDDGSRDNTIQILEDYCNKYDFITVLKENNIGVSKSFNCLCGYACENVEADYYAFCDQDDVWYKDKLIVAVNKLENLPNDKPNLYFSNLKMVDENLNYIRDLFMPGEVRIGSPMALIQVFTYGCTCVFNRKGLDDFCAIPINEMFHDHWIFELCTYLGSVYYDETAHINYRQHTSNVSGAKSKGLKLLQVRLNTFFKRGLDHNFDLSAKQILFFKNRVYPQYYDYVYKIAHYREHFGYKLSLLFSNTYKTGNLSKDIIIKFRILINKL